MISLKEIEKLSGLSRIKLESEEKENLQKDLEDILNYFNKLKSLDTSGVKEIDYLAGEVSNGVKNTFREDDKIRQIEEVNDYLKQAPQREDGYFKVKKII